MDSIRSSVMTTKSLIQTAPTSKQLSGKLTEASVPVTLDPCRTCSNPCDGGDHTFAHEEWNTKFFDVDLTSDMLGSVKPYGRQIVISTGKTDWEREVTDAKDSLAQHLSDVNSRLSTKASTPKTEDPPSTTSNSSDRQPVIAGLFSSGSSTRLGILNGSHISTSRDTSKETVLVFPDYKMVTEVENTPSAAELLWKATLDTQLGRAGAPPLDHGPSRLKSWTLPYSAVILICSHKRRDNRCGIAAPVLKRTLTESLESQDWEVCHELDDPEHFDEPPIEDVPGTVEEREVEILTRLKTVGQDPARRKRALVLNISHIGGHKYAGNVIIYTPQGAGVWYGRVSSHEVSAVTRTITEGKVFPELLRGGVNLSRPQGKQLNAW